jgi:hypothetical protein
LFDMLLQICALSLGAMDEKFLTRATGADLMLPICKLCTIEIASVNVCTASSTLELRNCQQTDTYLWLTKA